MLLILTRMTRLVMLLTLLLFMSHGALMAQELKKGDITPVQISSMVRWPGKRLVIIQFWNTLCPACIHSLAKIDSLQAKYSKEVQFVLVTSQAESSVDEFLELRRKIAKPRGVKFFYNDTLLKKYFPYTFVPHHVWISDEGKVVAVTSSINTHENSIEAYLATKASDLPGVTKRINYEWDVPVLSTQYKPSGKGTFHSYLLPAIDSFLPGTTKKRGGDAKVYNRIIIHAEPMLGLFLQAYSDGKDRFSYAYKNFEIRYRSAQPNDTALYLYDLQVPTDRTDQLYVYMRQDLERMFDFRASIEKRKVRCLVLKPSADTAKATTRGGKTATIPPNQKGDSLMVFRNMPMRNVVYILNRYSRPKGYLIVNETGISSNVDIGIRADIIDVLDIAQLKKDLFSYGILVEEGYCEDDVLVVSER